MISFDCPVCGKRLKAPDEGAGRKGRCSCGSVFVIPRPGNSGRVEVTDPDADLEPMLRRRRRRKAGGPGRRVLFGALGVVTMVACVWLIVRLLGGDGSLGRGGSALPSSPPESWTHQELLDHINRKGKKYVMHPTNRGVMAGPAALLVSPNHEHAWSGETIDALYGAGDDPVVYVQLRKTAQEARDAAGPEGSGAYAWGRFLFYGKPTELNKVRTALR
jgi:hypothetical protein